MNLIRRAGLCACLAFALAPAIAPAADFPTKPVRMIVVYGPGGANDIVARMVGAKMAETLGQPVVIENKPGASGMIGAQHVARSEPDGHTLLVGGSPLVVAPALFKTPLVDATKDFAPIGKMVDLPIVLVAAKSFPANTMQETAALGKSRPDGLTMAVTAPTYGLYMERLNVEANMAMRRIEYRGVAEAMSDVAESRVDLLIDTVGAQLPHLTSGRTKALAVFTSKRQPALPGVPTLEESGLAGFSDSPFIGLLTPAGTPASAIARLNAAMLEALANDEVSKKLNDMGFVVATSSPSSFSERIASDIERYRHAAERANIAKQ